jgi:hypothetical protein
MLWPAGALLLVVALAGCPFRDKPPDTPSPPTGPTYVVENTQETYFASASDPDGDSVYLEFDDEGEYYYGSSRWSGPVASGDTGSAQVSWWTPGTYLLRVRALDVHGLYSGWSPALSITVRQASQSRARAAVRLPVSMKP